MSNPALGNQWSSCDYRARGTRRLPNASANLRYKEALDDSDSDAINVMPFTTLLSAQIAKW